MVKERAFVEETLTAQRQECGIFFREVRLVPAVYEPVLLMEYGLVRQYLYRLDPCLVEGFVFLVGHRKYFRQVNPENKGNVALFGQDAVMLDTEYRDNIFQLLFHRFYFYFACGSTAFLAINTLLLPDLIFPGMLRRAIFFIMPYSPYVLLRL